MFDLDGFRIARPLRWSVFMLALSAATTAGCDGCSNRAKEIVFNRGMSSAAQETNDKLDALALTTGGATRTWEQDGKEVQVRVSTSLPARWPDDLVRPFHATVLKAVEAVGADGEPSPFFLALFESTDAIEEVEAYYRRAGGRNPFERSRDPFGDPSSAAPVAPNGSRVFVLRGGAMVFLSAGPGGRTRIGYQVTLFDELARLLSGALEDAGLAPLTQPSSERAAPPRHADVVTIDLTENRSDVTNAARALASLRPRFKQCYLRTETVPSSLVLRVGVLPTGDVDTVSVSESQGLAASASECIVGHTKRLVFDAPRTGKAELTVELTFEPPEKAP